MTPTTSTYTTKRLPFVGNPEQRTGVSISKDQLFVNFFAVDQKGVEGTKYMIEQRGGLAYQLGTVSGEGRGIYVWKSKNFYVVGSVLYKDGTAIQTLSTSTGTVGFQEFGNDVNQTFLIILDGISGWVIDESFTVTKITDVNFPSPHVVHAGFIDGYLVVAKTFTGDLYNSDLVDPFTWTPGNFISAESFPDHIVAVCRQNNYIVAIGSQTTEYFYDAGTAPGTPFARNSAALHQFGTPAPDTLAQIEEQVIFVGQTQTGGRTVWVLNGFNPTEIGIEPVNQSLDAEGYDISNAKAFCVRYKGHKFYVINLTSVTWVFDFDTYMWHMWADYTGASKFACNYACDDGSGHPVMLDTTKGYVYRMVEGVSKDHITPTTTANITSIAISDKFDFGTMNNKFMHRLSLLCDTPFTGTATCTLYWSDDDYQTYSTGRSIAINNTQPIITQLGRFRRRAFKLIYSDAYPIRIEGMEVDINVGSQ